MEQAWPTLEKRLGLSSSTTEQGLRAELAKKDEALVESQATVVEQAETIARLRAQLVDQSVERERAGEQK